LRSARGMAGDYRPMPSGTMRRLAAMRQRVYPWSTPPSSSIADSSFAVFWTDDQKPTGPDNVGSRPKGAGRWGHLDLGGNVAEAVLDWAGGTLGSCTDCAHVDSDAETGRVLRDDPWGGKNVKVSEGWVVDSTKRIYWVGGRCARVL
jgi:formylglycine-generating enzyme